MARTKQTARKSVKAPVKPKPPAKAPAKAPAKSKVASKTVISKEKVYKLTEAQLESVVSKIIAEKLAALSSSLEKEVRAAVIAVAEIESSSPAKEIEVTTPPAKTKPKPKPKAKPKAKAPPPEDVAIIPPKNPSKMTVKELKDFIEGHGIEMPKEGTGSKGAILKKDYVTAITDATGEADEPAPKPKPKAKAPPKKVPAPKAKAGGGGCPKKKALAAKKKPPVTKPKIRTLDVAFDEEQSLYVDDDNNVYDVKTSSVIGVSDGEGNVRPLKVTEARNLSKAKRPMWHQKVKKRPVTKVATKTEIASLLKEMRGDVEEPKTKTKAKPRAEPKEKKVVAPADSEEESESINIEGSEEGSEVELVESPPKSSGSSSPQELDPEELDAEGGIFEIRSSDEEEEEGSEAVESNIYEESTDQDPEMEEEDIAAETEEAMKETLKDEPVISEKVFTQYVEAQYSGKVDMADVPAVAKASGLDEDTVSNILLNYVNLLAQYPKVQTQAMLKARKGSGRGAKKTKAKGGKKKAGGKRKLLKKKN